MLLVRLVDREQGLIVAPGNPLGIHDIAKLLDVHNREVSSLLDAAEALGLLPPRMGRVSRPVQGNLLEVGA